MHIERCCWYKAQTIKLLISMVDDPADKSITMYLLLALIHYSWVNTMMKWLTTNSKPMKFQIRNWDPIIHINCRLKITFHNQLWLTNLTYMTCDWMQEWPHNWNPHKSHHSHSQGWLVRWDLNRNKRYHSHT